MSLALLVLDFQGGIFENTDIKADVLQILAKPYNHPQHADLSQLSIRLESIVD